MLKAKLNPNERVWRSHCSDLRSSNVHEPAAFIYFPYCAGGELPQIPTDR